LETIKIIVYLRNRVLWREWIQSTSPGGESAGASQLNHSTWLCIFWSLIRSRLGTGSRFFFFSVCDWSSQKTHAKDMQYGLDRCVARFPDVLYISHISTSKFHVQYILLYNKSEDNAYFWVDCLLIHHTGRNTIVGIKKYKYSWIMLSHMAL
jgi:hypothetical protein